ncbi:MAG: GGDEF domain-containing protein [Candidatus Enteromonas sp.]|nr:GGDEF domain-containing protein [Candidatus Enteromonas sp.]
MGIIEETYGLLKETSNYVVAKIPESNNLPDEEFFFLLNSFSVFELGNLRTPRDIVKALDPRSAICEARGYKDYVNDILLSLTDSETNHHPRTFILTLLDGPRAVNLTMSMYHSPTDNVRVFVFAALDIVAYDLNYFVKSAYQDRLTGLFNYFTLKEHLRSHERNGFLCLFDLNKFKELNDHYGHEFGDLVLQEIGSYLITIAHDDVIYYRRSGDEFFFLLFSDNLEEACALVKQIDRHLQTLGTTRFKNYPKMECSASFGMIRFFHNGKNAIFNDQNFFDACRCCDLAMYEAKLAKKQVVYFDETKLRRILQNGNIEQRIADLAKLADR